MPDTEAEHILLIDDDESFTGVLARALARRGYRVSRAASYQAALQLLAEDPPDKAIVDLNLGEEHTGLQLIPALKQAQPAMRIVVLTGYSSIATAVATPATVSPERQRFRVRLRMANREIIVLPPFEGPSS